MSDYQPKPQPEEPFLAPDPLTLKIVLGTPVPLSLNGILDELNSLRLRSRVGLDEPEDVANRITELVHGGQNVLKAEEVSVKQNIIGTAYTALGTAFERGGVDGLGEQEVLTQSATIACLKVIKASLIDALPVASIVEVNELTKLAGLSQTMRVISRSPEGQIIETSLSALIAKQANADDMKLTVNYLQNTRSSPLAAKVAETILKDKTVKEDDKIGALESMFETVVTAGNVSDVSPDHVNSLFRAAAGALEKRGNTVPPYFIMQAMFRLVKSLPDDQSLEVSDTASGVAIAIISGQQGLQDIESAIDCLKYAPLGLALEIGRRAIDVRGRNLKFTDDFLIADYVNKTLNAIDTAHLGVNETSTHQVKMRELMQCVTELIKNERFAASQLIVPACLRTQNKFPL